MQKGRVLSLRQFGIGEFFKNNYFLMLLAFCFIVGVLLGVFCFDDIKVLSEYPKTYFADYIASRTGKSFFSIFFSSVLSFWAVLFLSFLLGASIFGVVTIPCLVAVKGFFYGGVTAYLYSEFALKGIAFNAVVYVPSVIIFIIVLLVASREAIRFSLKLSSLTLNKTMPFGLSNDFKDYGIRYLIFALAMFLSSLCDACVSSSLLKYFTF